MENSQRKMKTSKPEVFYWQLHTVNASLGGNLMDEKQNNNTEAAVRSKN